MIKSVRYWALPVILFIIGIIQSVREDYFLWCFDSDISCIPLVLDDIAKHGFGYVKDFRFAIDNWLLTAFLPDALWFRLFGDGPVAMMMTGLALFVFTALLTGGLVAYVAGVRRGVWAAALTLCASRAALGWGGYLTYPLAHNVSVAWGLVALFCALIWFRRGNVVALMGMVFFLTAATFSDPWMLPTFDLPLMCACGVLWFWQKKSSARAAWHSRLWVGGAGGVLCAVLLGKTHFFGMLPIISENGGSLVTLSFSPKGIRAIFGALSYYFNLIPGVSFQDVGWDVDNHKILPVVGFVLVMLFNGIVLLGSMYMLLRRCVGLARTYDAARVFFFVFLLFSILGIASSAFVLGLVKQLALARYLVNIYYCVILLFFISPWECFSIRFRRFYIGLGALWVIANLVSNMGAWSFRSPLVRLPDTAIVSALEAEHIDKAYGASYWGSEANALTWLSHGKVAVRPLLYERDYHGFLPSAWSSPGWYKQSAHEKWALIITSRHEQDVCPPFPSCEDAALHQFGPPLAVRQAARAKFMIYDNDRVGAVSALSVNNWKTPLPLPDESTFRGWKSFYPNDAMNRSDLVTIEGWASPAHGTVASNAALARIGVPVPSSARQVVTLRLLLGSTKSPLHDVDVSYKGNIVAQWRVGLTPVLLTLELPVEAGERFVSCDLLIRDPGKGKHGTAEGVTLSEVQVIED